MQSKLRGMEEKIKKQEEERAWCIKDMEEVVETCEFVSAELREENIAKTETMTWMERQIQSLIKENKFLTN